MRGKTRKELTEGIQKFDICNFIIKYLMELEEYKKEQKKYQVCNTQIYKQIPDLLCDYREIHRQLSLLKFDLCNYNVKK